ncbi:stage V sporulation protein B [Peptococcaceae bacterium 1198_IL3148]
MKKQSFIYGAMILFIASLFNRIIGFGYQMVVIRLIKPEGVGLFNMVYPVYIMAMVLSTLGIPLAIAKLVAEEVAKGNMRGAYRIFYICLSILIITATAVTVGLYLSTPFLMAHYFPNPKVYYSFLALIPGIFVVSMCSAFRGFFQGLQQMTPTAVTQILEQLVRVGAGLVIAYLLLPQGIEYAAIGMSLGVVLGEITGCITMLIIFFRSRPCPKQIGTIKPLGVSLKNIFYLGIPVTLTRFISTAIMSIEAIIIPQRLIISGVSLTDATSMYGQFVGIAQTLLLTPAIITTALATALIPAVSDALAQNNLKLVQARTSEAIRLTNIAGLPCIVLFLLLPHELCGLLFGYREAGTSLAILALGGSFLYFCQTTTGILQGMGEAVRPFKNMLIASSFKIIGIYYLTSIPSLGIKGTAAVMSIYCIIYALLNYIDLKKLIGFRMYFIASIIKPLTSALIMGFVVLLTKQAIFTISGSLVMTTFGSIFSGMAIYLAALFLMGGVSPQDVERINKMIYKIIPKKPN